MSYISDEYGVHLGAPISIYDVQRCLGSTSPDLATLCMNNNVNMWSGIKPIWHTKVSELTDNDRAGRVLSGYKTGGGIKKRAYLWSDYEGSMASTSSYGNPASVVWTHDKPSVGGGCAFRLTDFNGYYHNQRNVFRIFSYIDNLDGIPIPSTPTGTGGAEIEFLLDANVVTGCVRPQVLFGDCINLSGNKHFYAGVILASGNGASDKHYVKTSDKTLESCLYASSGDTYLHVSFKVDTALFARAVTGGSASAYQSYPMRNGDKWTACVVLVDRQITGSTSDYTFNSTDTIVRLEYAENVDRWTLPIKQSKYSIITSMKMSIRFAKQSQQLNGHWRYKIAFIDVTATKATGDNVQFSVDGMFQCQIGNVSIENQGSAYNGEPLNVYIGSLKFTGTGTQTLTLYPNVYYELTSTTAGNQLLNGRLTFYSPTIGRFEGGWSVDAHNLDSEYVVTNLSII